MVATGASTTPSADLSGTTATALGHMQSPFLPSVAQASRPRMCGLANSLACRFQRRGVCRARHRGEQHGVEPEILVAQLSAFSARSAGGLVSGAARGQASKGGGAVAVAVACDQGRNP